MPTYDYVCDACGHQFEEFQKMTAELLTKCPACKKKKLRRLFGTGAALVFKGSGFYQTDYRSDNYKKSAAKEKESSGEGKKDKPAGNESGSDKSNAAKTSTPSPASGSGSAD